MPPPVSFALASAGFGWHAETAIHILRLAVSGTLDRFPKLKLIIGHMGEMLPFMLYRSEMVMPKDLIRTERSISEMLKSQVYITTSGIFTKPPFQLAMDTFGLDRILYSVDYPFAANQQGKTFLDNLGLPSDQMERLKFRNAQNLLHLSF